ncbi:MAG: imidazolonepropionase [Clostridia bacterium]|nr:imidazolonepropionase [Clostridia bacterium]
MPRKYQHTQELMLQIKEMLSQGMTQRQIEEKLGLTGYRPVHALLKRERKKDISGLPKQRGRKPAKTLQEYKYENKRLKMENERLRDFLSRTERK